MQLKKEVTIDNVYYKENFFKPAFKSIKKQRRLSGIRRIKSVHIGTKPHIQYDMRNFIESN